MKLLKVSTLAISMIISLASFSEVNVTPAMISQFKAMPQSQKQAIADQVGVKLDSGSSAINSNLATPQDNQASVNQSSNLSEDNNDNKDIKLKSNTVEASRRFGESLFRGNVSTFAPTDNAIVPNDYRLGTGDELIVQLFGKENQITTLQVNRDGIINFPKLGPISVAGLSFIEVQNLIGTRISQQFIGVQSLVSMGRLRAMNVFMSGEVRVPGAYSVSALTTVSQAIFQAGGVSGIGSLRDIQVKRNGQVISSFDFYDLLLHGDSSKDIRLQSGDVVFVPTYENVIRVTGEVKRPMAYEIKIGDTIGDVINMSGGYKSSAFAGELVLVKRKTGGDLPEVMNIKAGDEEALKMQLTNGDELRVLPLGNNILNSINLIGAVSRSGEFGWKDGMRVSDLINNPYRDLKPEADLGYSLIIRTNEELNIKVVQFKLSDVLLSPNSEKDPTLQALDTVLIFNMVGEDGSFSRETMLKPIIQKLNIQAVVDQPAMVANITGAVRSPMSYPINDNFTVADLIESAGGLDDSAYTKDFEILRTTVSDHRVAQELMTISYEDIHSVKLNPKDRIFVKSLSNWSDIYSVTLSGEVAHPGTYPLKKGETISSLIQRAGGLTKDAYINGLVYSRDSIARKQSQNNQKFINSARNFIAKKYLTNDDTQTQNINDISMILEQISSIEPSSRMIVDPQDLIFNDKSNFIVMDGDRINIPENINAISVIGEVRNPNSFAFDPDLDIDDYISLSAGQLSYADTDGIYIIKSSGRVIMPGKNLSYFSQNDRLESGDSIVVPIDHEYKDDLPFWRDITQVFYQGIVSIAALKNL